MKAEPKYRGSYSPYIVIADLPVEQQVPLNQWLIGQTREAIKEEGENKYNCCFYHDYSNWYDGWIKGETAPNND
ncbi:MAG: hypothetical protein BGN92_10050 [Sphingobacteriales bacterium 41-5]|nr:MAG: hypothetical protein BGN92_10050 [Sphingobacteriales bacterium 41-5]